MDLLQAAILGIVQGITEFLPVSSSGHLILFPHLFGWEPQGYDFDVIIHLATLLAIVWVLRGETGKIVTNLFRKKSEAGNLGWKIVLATLPVVVVGVIISGVILDSIRTTQIVAIQLVLWGLVLWVADIYSTKVTIKTKNVEKVGWWPAWGIGLAQAIALIPGASRSGVTMSAGLFLGLDRRTAAKFSFLLAIPAIAGAGFLTLLEVLEHGFETSIPALVIGFLAAFVSGTLIIKFLLKFLETASFSWFAIYRILLGLLILTIF